jgi:hypothetical protein
VHEPLPLQGPKSRNRAPPRRSAAARTARVRPAAQRPGKGDCAGVAARHPAIGHPRPQPAQAKPEQSVSANADTSPAFFPQTPPLLTSPFEPRHQNRSSPQPKPPDLATAARRPNYLSTTSAHTRRLDRLPHSAHTTPPAHFHSCLIRLPGCRRPAPHQPATRLGWDHPRFTWQAEEGGSGAKQRTPLPRKAQAASQRNTPRRGGGLLRS